MIIEKMKLCNFRAADKITLEFSEKLNLFVGVNGSGKSTILDALSICLSWLVKRVERSKGRGRHISDLSIRSGQPQGYLDLHVSEDDTSYRWFLTKTAKGKKSDLESQLGGATALAEKFKEEYEEQSTLPVIAYYPVNRNVLDIPLRISKTHEFNPFECYDGALETGANFRHFFEWFRNREDLENENKKYMDAEFKPENIGDVPDTQLKAVRTAFANFIPSLQEFSVRRNPLRMVAYKNGLELRIEQFSDGEKNLIALVGDIARRLAIANPNSENPLNGKGVILIDEIDLHLHPGWQRIIIMQLLKTFPNCQFFISTHSPQVISHVKPENIFLLSLEGGRMIYSKPIESYGKNTDSILEDLLHVDSRPTDEKNQLHIIFSLIQEGRLDEAKEKIRLLRTEIGEDPELVKADVLIRRKEIIGK